MRTCIIIPTYNEEKSIGDLVEEIKDRGFDIVVCDDGSKDGTTKIAFKKGAIVLKNEKNLGKGYSLRRGFDYALEEGYQAVITMDGDGQHSPSYIPEFLEFSKEKDAKIVVGNRMPTCRQTGSRYSKMPFIRLFTNKLMSLILSFICKQKIPDSQCGFRLIRREVLKKVNLYTKKFEIESEILIRAARTGFRIESLPIKSIYRGQTSSINPVLDTFRFIRFIIKEVFFKHR